MEPNHFLIPHLRKLLFYRSALLAIHAHFVKGYNSCQLDQWMSCSRIKRLSWWLGEKEIIWQLHPINKTCMLHFETDWISLSLCISQPITARLLPPPLPGSSLCLPSSLPMYYCSPNSLYTLHCPPSFLLATCYLTGDPPNFLHLSIFLFRAIPTKLSPPSRSFSFLPCPGGLLAG